MERWRTGLLGWVAADLQRKSDSPSQADETQTQRLGLVSISPCIWQNHRQTKAEDKDLDVSGLIYTTRIAAALRKVNLRCSMAGQNRLTAC